MGARQIGQPDHATGASTFRGTALRFRCAAALEGFEAVVLVRFPFMPRSSRFLYASEMIRFLFIGLAVVATGLSATEAAARELDRAELRENVQNGRSMSFAQLVDRILALVEGDVMDVRAFDFGGIYYRVLIKQTDGRLVSVVLDAATGAAMPTRSSIAGQVTAAARANQGQGVGAQAANNSGGNAGGGYGGPPSGEGGAGNANAGGRGNAANEDAGGGNDGDKASGNASSSGGGNASGGGGRGGGGGGGGNGGGGERGR